MIRKFKNNGLEELFLEGDTAKISSKMHARCIEVLKVIHAATNVQQLNIPGYKLHQLKQYKPIRFSIWITGAWRITFEFEKGDAYRVDFEQYH